jgi:hypothetical protein
MSADDCQIGGIGASIPVEIGCYPIRTSEDLSDMLTRLRQIGSIDEPIEIRVTVLSVQDRMD